MTNSVTEITCNECKTKFSGVLNDLFNISYEYTAKCPNCKKPIFIMGTAAFIDVDIPKDAVQLMEVSDSTNVN